MTIPNPREDGMAVV